MMQDRRNEFNDVPWQQGRMLWTALTRRMSPEFHREAQEREARSLFAHFSAQDEGRSRVFLWKYDAAAECAAAVEQHNRELAASIKTPNVRARGYAPTTRNERMVMDKFMVFDVESIGMHGDGFAVAWVVVNRDGERLGEGCMACPRDLCAGTDESRMWVDENVPALDVTSPTPQHLRNTFWHEWRHWADQGAVLVADCAWPVEANFLSACVRLNHAEREWQGPYPLHDLASVILALGGNALELTERLPDELPVHHPLMDARQSARQLVACLKAHNAELTGPRRPEQEQAT